MAVKSEEWRCQSCLSVSHQKGSRDWPATWPVALWCVYEGKETLHDRVATR